MPQVRDSHNIYTHAYIAIGSNLLSATGRPLDNVRDALEAISDAELPLVAVSSFYLTPSHPPNSGPDFVNAVAEIRCESPLQTILNKLHMVEDQFGRRRDQRWGARSLDLDLLAAGDAVLPDLQTHQSWVNKPLAEQLRDTPDTLILPHPRLQDRAFVLVPLNEIAPEWCHPVTGVSVWKMLANLPRTEIDAIKRIE